MSSYACKAILLPRWRCCMHARQSQVYASVTSPYLHVMHAMREAGLHQTSVLAVRMSTCIGKR
eukprot:123211-Chlamydomonas_euryale.AAC.3